MELLNQYNYHIIYRPGNQNGAADALSRRAKLTPTDPPEELPQTMIPAHRLIAEISPTPPLLSDEQIHSLIKTTPLDKVPPKVEIINGLPYHNERVYVPTQSDTRKHVMALYHDSPLAGHLGQSGTLDLIRRQYWWPHMATTVAEYIQSCNPCSQNKHPNQQPPGALQVLPTPEGPWEWTQSDHITSLPRSRGFNAIYVVMDRLTKMAHLIPTTDRANAEDLAQLHLANVWRLHGVPKIHNTDKGSLFTAEYTRRFFKGLGINQRFSTPYHPQTQGQVENNNKWIGTYLRIFCNHQQNDWADLLHTAEFAYNNHHHPSIGMSPFKANYGYDMTLTGEGPTRGRDVPLRLAHLTRLHARCKLWLAQTHKKQELQYGRRTRDTPPLKEGDKVWISSRDLLTDRPSPKLEVLRYSPFPVKKVTGPLTYQINLPTGWQTHDVFHRSKLTLATEPAAEHIRNPVTNPTLATPCLYEDQSMLNSLLTKQLPYDPNIPHANHHHQSCPPPSTSPPSHSPRQPPHPAPSPSASPTSTTSSGCSTMQAPPLPGSPAPTSNTLAWASTISHLALTPTPINPSTSTPTDDPPSPAATHPVRPPPSHPPEGTGSGTSRSIPSPTIPSAQDAPTGSEGTAWSQTPPLSVEACAAPAPAPPHPRGSTTPLRSSPTRPTTTTRTATCSLPRSATWRTSPRSPRLSPPATACLPSSRRSGSPTTSKKTSGPASYGPRQTTLTSATPQSRRPGTGSTTSTGGTLTSSRAIGSQPGVPTLKGGNGPTGLPRENHINSNLA
jgi:transposase InsO family protein